MVFPHTYFWRLAQKPILVYNGRVYQLELMNFLPEKNPLSFNNETFKLHESETLLNLEFLYQLDNAEQIDTYKTDFLNKMLQKRLTEKIKSIDQTKKMMVTSIAVKVIIEKILPALEGKGFIDHALKKDNEMDDLDKKELNDELKKKEEKQLRDIQKKANIRKELISGKYGLDQEDENKDISILGKYVFHNFNVLVDPKNKFYILKTGGKEHNFVQIKDKKFSLVKYTEHSSIKHIESVYLKLITSDLNLKTIKESSDIFKKLQRYHKQQKILKKLIKGNKYVGDHFSFEKIGENIYLFYIHFPQFVNKFPNTGSYHLFPAGRMMLRAVYKPWKQDFEISEGTIAVEGEYKHPFTDPYEKRGKSHLCMGSLKYPPKNIPGYESIPQVLLAAKTMLMSGYNAKHENVRNVYTHIYSNYISYSSAKRKGIPITNINIINGPKIDENDILPK